MNLRNNFRHTLYASYLGYITQAIVNNLAPLLFLTFQRTFSVSLSQIAFLVTINFGVQLLVDLLSVRFVDKIGYRICIVAAHVLAALGLWGMGVFPGLLGRPYAGLVLASVFYAIGGGLIEVLISPIVEAAPTENKSGSMSLLHSFYCWGQVLVVVGSTLFFSLAGIGRWRLLTTLWALVPLCNAFYFSQVPIGTLVAEEDGMSVRELCTKQIFWILMVLMLCAGASELAMSQWASAFAESGLGVSKTMGDLMGPCVFAVLMGTARTFYAKYSEKIDLQRFILGSSALCVVSYLLAGLSPNPILSLVGCGLCGLSVGILWPGTFSIAASWCPRGGTAMFALLALGGDLGGSTGPTMVGILAGRLGGGLKSALLFSIVFPVALILGVLYLKRHLNRVP